MIQSERVRAMNDQEKFAYYLTKMVDDKVTENERQDCITVISDLLKGININDLASKMNVSVVIDTNTVPATLTVTVPNTDKQVVFDVAVPDRNQFDGANPEANARPVKSMLTEDEKKDLQATTGVALDK